MRDNVGWQRSSCGVKSDGYVAAIRWPRFDEKDGYTENGMTVAKPEVASECVS
jgi:hypothetical protein